MTPGTPVAVDVYVTAWGKRCVKHTREVTRKRMRGEVVQVTPRFVAVRLEVGGAKYVECFGREELEVTD